MESQTPHQPAAPPDDGLNAQQLGCFGGRVESIPELRERAAALVRAVRAESTATLEVGRQLAEMRTKVTRFGWQGDDDQFFAESEKLLGVGKQSVRHRLRIWNQRDMIRAAAEAKGRDYPSLTMTDMLDLIRVSNKGKGKKDKRTSPTPPANVKAEEVAGGLTEVQAGRATGWRSEVRAAIDQFRGKPDRVTAVMAKHKVKGGQREFLDAVLDLVAQAEA